MDSILAHILAATEARSTGNEKWMGHCQAHGSKRHRDLSIRLTSERILLHCFAACETEAICESLGIEQRHLFFDSLDPDPQRRKAAAQQRDRQRHARERHAQQQGALIDALREADYFVESRRGIDISTRSHDRLNDELNALADGYALLEKENFDGQLG